jgi:RNA polymerase sigma-70 factor (ECF subfamily)
MAISNARNLVSDFYRSRKKEKLVDKDDIQTASNDDPSKEVENRFNAKELRDAISKLKGMKQKVITLRFIDGFSYTEIARILRKTEGAVRVIQFRALADLKKNMRNPIPED